ncbi:ABC transporter, inner membrane subunit [Candidatus Koribacter versatilis Ellin345]|uniref:ABC transporter, inner membrane subunit n=1 Tax=Koribacter versatilis (strain Ellin345) TaxID=204669 RepID=Q1IMB5_KORVE|nr:hypothetical protein [Candidatus Koribacter versatilis]ABF41985.1 ABC transporter, inner membrane subunit [Candidatus Koribacter versatilis Ellin345]
MNASSNLMMESQVTTTSPPAAQISAMRRFVWCVRRELWENRSIYLAPLAIGGVVLTGFAISLLRLPDKVRALSAGDPMRLRAVVEQPFLFAALILMMVDMVVAAFYCLDALYGERRDRSILFWKSLPVSDLMTVLAKASIPILVLPLVSFAVTVATQIIMLIVGSVVFAAHGMSASVLWTHVPVLQTAGIHFYHLVVYHGLWYAPFYGWLLLVSAWSKRTPLLWAVLPAVAVVVIEKIAFNTSYFGGLLLQRLGGSSQSGGGNGMTMDMLTPHHAGQFLVSPGLWFGFVLTAGFLLAAARLRRWRGAV